MTEKPTVAVYYFPNWHPCKWNEKSYGAGNSEWENVKKAKPRFSGHQQPKVPVWGYTDESDPAVMEQKIEAAAQNGVDVFIYDWYWWENGPSLEACLEKGYMNARNNQQVKFGIMWANHRPVPRAIFDQAIDHIVDAYMQHPSYWRIDNKLYFSIYELHTLMAGLGGEDETRRAINSFREKAVRAGVGEIHLNAVEWGLRNLPDSSQENQSRLIRDLGIDSVTDYVWIHHVELENFPENDYLQVAEKAYWDWEKFSSAYPVPYHPNVTMGWDSWPRVPVEKPFVPGAYPATPLITQNSPAVFQSAMQKAINWLSKPDIAQKVLTINAWNEWTEGSYLEPDTINGMGYLEAIKKATETK